jgi:XisH protein
MTNSYTIADPILSFACSFADGMFIDRQDPQVDGYTHILHQNKVTIVLMQDVSIAAFVSRVMQLHQDRGVGGEGKGLLGKQPLRPSAISEFHTAVGQYLNYLRALRAQEPNRVLYLAVPSQTYDEFFRLRFIAEGIEEYQICLIIYDVEDRSIVKWTK